MSYKRADHFSKRAQKEGYAARSVYKLQEMQSKFVGATEMVYKGLDAFFGGVEEVCAQGSNP